jgi:Delta3-Delta2-enoyl-CoA isomerase
MSARIERDGPLACLRLDKERGNAIDEALVDALMAGLDALGRDDTVRGVLLCSGKPKMFCPGLDLIALETYDASGLARFISRFSKLVRALYGFPKPLVTAVNGTAVAGGCILALASDERLLRRGAAIGLNEVKIGVPLPWSVTVLVRGAIPPPSWTEVALAGSNFSDEEAVRVGLANAVLEVKGFETACIARLARLADKDGAAYSATKRYLREGLLAEMQAQEAYRAPEFVNAWFSAETSERRRQIVETLKK